MAMSAAFAAPPGGPLLPRQTAPAPAGLAEASAKLLARPSGAASLGGQVLSKAGVALALGVAAAGRRVHRSRAKAARVAQRAEAVADVAAPVREGQRTVGRAAHWVIRTTNLKRTVDFCSDVLSLKVLRHEELEAGCKITCNGAYAKPWSKTMVGDRTEDLGYCLEVTYTYGVDSYTEGSGLKHIAVAVSDVKAALEAATRLGYAVEGDVVTGPEAYKFRLVPQSEGRSERFLYSAVRVKNMAKAEEFYTAIGLKALGLGLVGGPAFLSALGVEEAAVRVMGFGGAEEVPLVLIEDTKSSLFKLQTWEGRNLLSIPTTELRSAYNTVIEKKPAGGRVLHKLQSEPLNKLLNVPDLEIAVLVAPEGFEVGIVSSESFDPAVKFAYNPEAVIDYAWRENHMATVLEEMAQVEELKKKGR